MTGHRLLMTQGMSILVAVEYRSYLREVCLTRFMSVRKLRSSRDVTHSSTHRPTHVRHPLITFFVNVFISTGDFRPFPLFRNQPERFDIALSQQASTSLYDITVHLMSSV